MLLKHNFILIEILYLNNYKNQQKKLKSTKIKRKQCAFIIINLLRYYILTIIKINKKINKHKN